MSLLRKNENSSVALDFNGSFSTSIQTSVFTISFAQSSALWWYCANTARMEPEHFVQHLLLKKCHVLIEFYCNMGLYIAFKCFFM